MVRQCKREFGENRLCVNLSRAKGLPLVHRHTGRRDMFEAGEELAKSTIVFRLHLAGIKLERSGGRHGTR